MSKQIRFQPCMGLALCVATIGCMANVLFDSGCFVIIIMTFGACVSRSVIYRYTTGTVLNVVSSLHRPNLLTPLQELS